MNGLKKTLDVFRGQFLASLGNGRIWAGYLIGIGVTMVGVYRYIGYADTRVYQIFEPYLDSYVSIWTTLLVLIGYFVVLSDAPFVDHRSLLALYRSSRRQWFWGMSLYILVHTFFYYAIPLLLSCLYGMKQGYLHNLWSRPMRQLVAAPSQEALQHWHLSVPYEGIITGTRPLTALIHTLLLMMMYSLLLAMVLFVFNLIFSRAAGTAIAAGIHVIGYILAYAGIGQAFERWSLFLNAQFMQTGPVSFSTLHSYLYFLFVLCLIFFVAPWLMCRADFKYSAGEQDG